MKITRHAIRITNPDGFIDWAVQGQPSGDYDPFAFAILYATEGHAERAKKSMLKKFPGLNTPAFKIDIVPVTVEVNV
jgi:hypothetical protein